MMACVVIGVALSAQQRPLTPLPTGGLRVAPFFDGWYANPDGTMTFSFGYSNLNRDDTVEIPIGSDNFIEPKEYDGRQPTSFVPAVNNSGDDAGAAAGAGAGTGTGAGAVAAGGANRPDRRDRERGVFGVTVPAGFKGDVVWTLRVQGQTYRVPARSKTGAYQLRWPMAMGSMPPLLRFTSDGPAGRGPAGIVGGSMQTSVGTPLKLTVFLHDDSVREPEPIQVKERAPGPKGVLNVTWYKHAGPPGRVTFSPAKEALAELKGTATTTVTFAQAGEYRIRVKADNFGRVDSSAGNQCCWTNGYVPVTVTP